MLNFKELNNQVVLEGTIINSVRQKYNKESDEQIVYFVLGVPRTDYPLVYNKDEYNYFYCYGSEILMGGTFLDQMRKDLKMYQKINIWGILDNVPYQTSKAKEVNYRAIHCYCSRICVTDYKIIKRSVEEKDKEAVIINSVRKLFGKDVEVKIDKEAMKKDYFGLEDNNLPDY